MGGEGSFYLSLTVWAGTRRAILWLMAVVLIKQGNQVECFQFCLFVFFLLNIFTQEDINWENLSPLHTRLRELTYLPYIPLFQRSFFFFESFCNLYSLVLLMNLLNSFRSTSFALWPEETIGKQKHRPNFSSVVSKIRSRSGKNNSVDSDLSCGCDWALSLYFSAES